MSSNRSIFVISLSATAAYEAPLSHIARRRLPRAQENARHRRLRAARLHRARRAGVRPRPDPHRRLLAGLSLLDRGRRARKSVVSGPSVSVRVALGGRRSIKKKNNLKTI